jgi:hypothetical protein
MAARPPSRLEGIEVGPGWETVVPTRICMTCGSCGAGFETGLCGLWFFITSVSPANFVKSTITSARSAGASTRFFT